MAIKRNLSYHISEDRLDRAAFITMSIGIGEIVKEKYCVDEQGRPAWKCMTDTGVILILNGRRDKVVTLYIATLTQLSWMYDGNAPYNMYHTVQKNKRLIALQELPLEQSLKALKTKERK